MAPSNSPPLPLKSQNDPQAEWAGAVHISKALSTQSLLLHMLNIAKRVMACACGVLGMSSLTCPESITNQCNQHPDLRP